MRMEKRKKFHDALLKIYYPSTQTQVPQEPQASPVAEEEPVEVSYTIDEQSDAEPELEEAEIAKLTRAQRKRIRRRKLKESTSNRRKIIGPLMPSSYEHPVCSIEEASQGENC